MQCPFGPHTDRHALLNWEAIKCTRHTTMGTVTGFYGLRDIARRKRGMAEHQALEMFNEVEDQQLLQLSKEVEAETSAL